MKSDLHSYSRKMKRLPWKRPSLLVVQHLVLGTLQKQSSSAAFNRLGSSHNIGPTINKTQRSSIYTLTVKNMALI